MASPASLKRTYADACPEDLDLNTEGTNSLSARSVILCQVSSSQDLASPSDSPQNPTNHPSAMPTGEHTNTMEYTDVALPAESMQQVTKRSKLTFAEKEAKRVERESKDLQKVEGKAKREEEKRLADAEREAKRLLKEIKDQQKAEERAKKEIEKAQREEEKKAREVAKEERRKAKDEQLKVKQEEKLQKEEEKSKKARSQLRLNAFFPSPAVPKGISTASPGQSPLSSRRSSLADIHDKEVPRGRSRSISSTPQKSQQPDYKRIFPDFFLQSYTTLAPINRFSQTENGLSYFDSRIDNNLVPTFEARDDSFNSNSNLKFRSSLRSSLYKRRRLNVPRVKDIVAEIHGTASYPIDLTDSQVKRATQKPLDLLQAVPMKFLKFAEDVRPPYIGTFTKLHEERSISKLSRRPFSHCLPATNYDYDSEAEWEEPGEGEDLESEGEEELGDDEEEDEMEGFLDDEGATDANALKRRPLMGDLMPLCSGISWDGPQTGDTQSELSTLNLASHRLDILMDNPQLPIDPYSTTYWHDTASAVLFPAVSQAQGTPMDPPRLPLKPTNRQNTLLLPASSPTTMSKDISTDISTSMKPPKPPKRLIAPDLMDEFKRVVHGDDSTKVGLLEILKKKFPKQPKDAIRDTLELIAERIGSKPSEKKWVLKSGF